MSDHLLVITVGPVQDFISASRRTRDLWFGSELLSQISSSVANYIKARIDNASAGSTPSSQSGKECGLVFPAPDSQTGRGTANIILAILPGSLSPSDIAEKAKEAAKGCWHEYAKETYVAAQEWIDEDVWKSQVNDVVEFYAAWVSIKDNSVDKNKTPYQEAREHVMRLLAGRKACHDFIPANGIARRPKSSLDGARESIWNLEKIKQGVMGHLKTQLRLQDGEQLDAVGLTKRLGGGKKGYPSVTRIAVDPWLRGIKATAIAQDSFRELIDECEKHANRGHIGRVNWPQFAHFPFEGEAIIPERLADLKSEQDINSEELKPLADKVKTLRESFGQPEPYLAIIVADGDKMGKTISAITTPEVHRHLSARLAEFSVKAGKVVEKNHGCLVYSGGDDVLAFVSLDKCLVCAHELHKEFGDIAQTCEIKGDIPTLSVGIAIGHYFEPLEDLLNFARNAEKEAKNGYPERDGLAVHIHYRSGVPITVRDQWGSGIYVRLHKWIDLYIQGLIPNKAAYDLRQIAIDYSGWPRAPKTTGAIKADIIHLLSRKMTGDGPINIDLIIPYLDKYLNQSPSEEKRDIHDSFHDGVLGLANEWLIAQQIAKSCMQATGKTSALRLG
jgi:CRISPR-associated protein Cmr2